MLEVLIAVAVTGLVSIALANLLVESRQVFDRVHIEQRAASQLEATRAFLENVLGQVYPLDPSRSGVETNYPVQGTPTALELSAPFHPDQMQSDLYRLRLVHDPGSSAIQFFYRPDRDEFATLAEQQGPDVLTGVQNMSIGYLELLSDARSTNWASEWVNRTDLPLAIRFNMTMQDTTQLVWFLPAKRSGHQDCTFDPVSRTCL